MNDSRYVCQGNESLQPIHACIVDRWPLILRLTDLVAEALTSRAADNEMAPIMHTTTTHIPTVGAGRRQSHFLFTDPAYPDMPDVFVDLQTLRAKDMPVTESPEHKMCKLLLAIERRKASVHFSMLKEGGKVRLLAAAAAVKQWKARITEMSKDKVPGAGGENMKRLLHHAGYLVAFHEENEKARLALKTSALDYCTSEEFDEAFPPSLQYISRALAEEIADKVWAELASAKK